MDFLRCPFFLHLDVPSPRCPTNAIIKAMRLLCLLMLPCLAMSCGRDPLQIDPSSSGLNGEAKRRDQEQESSKNNTAPASEEVTVIDTPEDPPQPDADIVLPIAPPPIFIAPLAPSPTGREACLFFAPADQGVFNFESGAWQYQVQDCQSSACWDFFSINIQCSLSFQHDNKMKTAIAPPDLCRYAARMFTSPRFETATKACPMINQPINESFEVVGAVNVRRKFSFCNTPEMEQARACLRWVIDSTLGTPR